MRSLRSFAKFITLLVMLLGLTMMSMIAAPQAAQAQTACSVDYNVVNQWGTGFQANVTITNNTATAVQGWDLTWTFGPGEGFSSGWNATFAPSGSSMSASNVTSHWNGNIGANGGTVSFGFIGSHSGNIAIPADFAVNGVSCSDTADTEAPTVPTNLASPAQTTSSIDLTWTASTDNVGVVGYDVYRDGALAGSSTTTSFSDTGLADDTLYSYTVVAKDAAGNESTPSAALAVSTEAIFVDTEPPTVPTGLASPAQTTSSIALTWVASTDNVGVTGYDIYRDGALAGSSTSTSFSDTGLADDTLYSYTVVAKDAAGNESAASAALAVSTEAIPVDTEPPTVPTGLASPSQTTSSIDLTWNASTDNVGVVGYDVYRDGVEIGSSTNTSFTDTGLTADTSYSYQVLAKDAAGNESALSSALAATTDEEVAAGACLVTYDDPATWDGGFNIQNIYIKNLGSEAINGWTLTFRFTNGETVSSAWNANISQSGDTVTATNVGHNGTIASQGTVSFGFNGSQSNGVGPIESFQLNGMGCGDTEPPTTPTNLSSPNQTARAIELAWTASNDNVGISSYTIFRDGVAVGTSTTNNFTDTGLEPETSYSYTVQAKDPAGNLSGISSPPYTVATTAPQPAAVFRVNEDGRITKDGEVLPVQCGSWFGLEGRHEPSSDPINPSGAAMELYVGNTNWVNGGAGSGRTIQQTMDEIKALGINVIRMPIAPQTLDPTDPQGLAPNLKNHESVLVPNARQALEEFLVLADQNGLEVMLDIHSCSNYVGWRAGRFDARPPYVDKDREFYDYTREEWSCAATNNPATVTDIQAYDEAQWLDDLRELAGLADQLEIDNIIGIDIFNEPWDYTWEEWKTLTEHAYVAINEVNPNILLFVQGISATAGNQDGTPETIVQVPHGDEATNPNWGENLFEAGANPPNVPRERLVYSPHTYGPSVFVQKGFMDPAQPECEGLEGDEAGDADCNIVINGPQLREGWEEHFGYLKDLGYAIVVGEFGGNMDWPQGASSLRDQQRWDHITPGVDQEWQEAFVGYMADRGLEGCYWSINPESGDTGGIYEHAYDPVSNESGWGEWLDFDTRKTDLLTTLWAAGVQ